MQIFKRLQGKLRMKRFYAFDIETVYNGKDKGKFLLGNIYDGELHIWFSDREKMQKFICNSAFIGTTFIAYNLEYDLNRIFLDDPRLERYYQGSQLVYAKYPFPSGKTAEGKQRYKYIWFYDAAFHSYFAGIKKLGDMLNKKKLKDYYSNTINKKLIAACQRDTEITYFFMIYFQDVLNGLGGSLKSTLAGCAMDLYRRMFMPPEAEYFDIPFSILDDYRQAYYGGRTEVFNLNKIKNVYYYDINSSYPASMMLEYPDLKSWVNKPDLDYEGITYCKIEHPYMYYPVLPFRGDKLIFPVGTWQGWYCNNELRYAISQGIKVTPIRGYHYTKSIYPFKDYINTLYNLRLRPGISKAESKIYKTLMNSLYGRFGMNFGGLEKIQNKEREKIGGKPVFVNVIWAAMITAYSRIALHKFLVETESIYCDTDSTISRIKNVKTSNRLGDLKLEKTLNWFKADAPKHYEYQEKRGEKVRKLKGIPKRAEEKIDLAGQKYYTYEIPIKYKSSKKRKIPLYSWIKIDKYPKLLYTKRVVNEDGTTEPIMIREKE